MRLANIRPQAVDLPLVYPGSVTSDNPSGVPTGVTLKVLGKDSKEYQDAVAAVYSNVKPNATPAEGIKVAKELTLDILRAVIVGGVDAEEPDAPFDVKEFMELLAKGEHNWVIDQVNRKLEDRAAFFNRSQQTSASA